MKFTGIIILNYNNTLDTFDCVKSIKQFNTSPVKFIIVDNGSVEDDTGKKLKSFCETEFGTDFQMVADSSEVTEGKLPTCTLVLSPTNDGYARGNNKGLAVTYKDEEISNVVIINNDILFESDILPGLLSRYETLDSPGILTPLLRNMKKLEYNCARRFPDYLDIVLPFLLFNRNYKSIISDHYRSQMILLTEPEYIEKDSFRIDVPSGSFIFIDKDLFKSVEGFEPDTFLYFEEVILCRRLERLKRKNYCVPSLSAFHKGAKTTSKAGDVFLQKCNLESADVYFKKECDLTLPQKALWGIVKVMWRFKFLVKRKELRSFFE